MRELKTYKFKKNQNKNVVLESLEFENSKTDKRIRKRKQLERYVDDINCTVRGDQNNLLKLENLHINLFTMEKSMKT